MKMIIITKNKRYRIDVQRFLMSLITIIGIVFLIWLSIDFAMTPEKYLLTWR